VLGKQLFPLVQKGFSMLYILGQAKDGKFLSEFQPACPPSGVRRKERCPQQESGVVIHLCRDIYLQNRTLRGSAKKGDNVLVLNEFW